MRFARFAPLAVLVACALLSCDEDGDGDGGSGGGDAGSGGSGTGGSGGAVCPVPGTDELDPASGIEQSGTHGCPGCPQSDPGETTIEAGAVTSREFTGSVVKAECGDGVFYVRGPGGREIAGAIHTDATAGTYAFTAPLFCGEQLVKLVWANPAGKLVVVLKVTTEDCTEPDLRVTLSWDALGQDWELHLIRPGGRINDQENNSDCTWTTCIDVSPDWPPEGSDGDPKKDVDNTETYGPENIFLSGLEAGTYTVMVEHWGEGDPRSSGLAILNVAGKTVVVPIDALAPQHVRTVATIDGATGKITAQSTDFDCTGEWDDGCLAALP